MQTKLFHIVFWIFVLSASCGKVYAQELPKSSPRLNPKEIDTTSVVDKNGDKTTIISTQKDSLKPKSEKLEGIISRSAKSKNTNNLKTNISYLEDEARITYLDMQLEAGIIIIDRNKNEVYAKGIVDEDGVYTQVPKFTQGTNLVTPDSIRFNFNSGKSLVYGSRTQQGELNIKAPISKKENDSTFYMKNAFFTTSKDVDKPEYGFNTSKIKLVPGEKIIVGPTYMDIMNVPTPIGIPFAFFPITTKNASGFIIPTFGENTNQGYYYRMEVIILLFLTTMTWQ